jgi:hypothetical protein
MFGAKASAAVKKAHSENRQSERHPKPSRTFGSQQAVEAVVDLEPPCDEAGSISAPCWSATVATVQTRLDLAVGPVKSSETIFGLACVVQALSLSASEISIDAAQHLAPSPRVRAPEIISPAAIPTGVALNLDSHISRIVVR